MGKFGTFRGKVYDYNIYYQVNAHANLLACIHERMNELYQCIDVEGNTSHTCLTKATRGSVICHIQSNRCCK